MAGRNSILAVIAGLGAMFFAFALPTAAAAQCCAPPQPPCCAPPPPCCQPPSPPPASPPCCTPGHNINVPSVNVFVGGAVIVNAQVNASVNASASGSGGGVVYFGGGGGGGGYAPPVATGVIGGLSVQGAERMNRVAYEATRTIMRRVVIQAFCLDDRQIPHPASQVQPDRDVNDAYDGEIYRCIAGTRMQVTVAEYNGSSVSFAGGQTLMCAKGEALYHVRSSSVSSSSSNGSTTTESSSSSATVSGGRMECRPQAPARDCNERSLLRRFGAGIKILTILITEKYTAYREERVTESSSSSSSSSFSLDGGVGGSVY
ncbi:MAG: hypothetical protein U1E50_17175 [Caulobacteraceae bacterium]